MLFCVIWPCLAIHNWNDNSNFKKHVAFIYRQKIKFILYVFLEMLHRFCKIIVRVLWACLAMQTESLHIHSTLPTHRKLSCLFAGKKSTSCSPHAILEILQRYPNFLLCGYFGHDWLHTPKMIVSSCKRLRFLPACQKINFIIHSFLQILHFKESCNLIGWLHFSPQLNNQNFDNNNISFHFRLFSRKTSDKMFQKNPKLHFRDILGPFLGKNEFSWKKRALSIFRYSNYLPLCQKLKKTIEPLLRKMPNWRMDTQTHRQRDNVDFIGPSVGRGSKMTHVIYFIQ